MNNRTTLIAIIVILALVLAVVGYLYWQETQRNTLSVQVGNGELTIQTN
jgi:hypothetical protein